MMAQELLAMRDIADGQLESSDERNVGRVADAVIEIGADGQAHVTRLCIGPEALCGRLSSRIPRYAHWIFRGRFEYTIPIAEVTAVGPTVRLKSPAHAYPHATAERWVLDHILRFIPGNGKGT